MMPFLSPLSSAAVRGVPEPAGEETLIPPPYFKPLRGEPRDVAFTTWKPPRSKGRTQAQKLGLRYEQKVVEALEQEFGAAFVSQPSIGFHDASGPRVGIPDGLVRLGNAVGIIEIKYSHTPLAWWQLRKLYEPLLHKLTTAKILLFEICHTYDPGIDFPEPHGFIHSLRSPPTLYPVNVIQWRP